MWRSVPAATLGVDRRRRLRIDAVRAFYVRDLPHSVGCRPPQLVSHHLGGRVQRDGAWMAV
ncbi:MAG: hypothetical protein CL482_02990 [Acidobacteria bacterium]|nr:hypothetical protein [Acidobacteriota bacterium]